MCDERLSYSHVPRPLLQLAASTKVEIQVWEQDLHQAVVPEEGADATHLQCLSWDVLLEFNELKLSVQYL